MVHVALVLNAPLKGMLVVRVLVRVGVRVGFRVGGRVRVGVRIGIGVRQGCWLEKVSSESLNGL